MKNVVIALFYGLLLLFASCEEEDQGAEQVNFPGETVSEVYTMNSKENKGFSVERLKIADFPKSDADFIIIPQTNLTGDVISPFLSNPNLEKRFILSGEFTDLNTAEAHYESHIQYPAGVDLQQFATNIKPNQVWLVKTQSGTFCKMLILETTLDKVTSFAELKFKAEKIM